MNLKKILAWILASPVIFTIGCMVIFVATLPAFMIWDLTGGDIHATVFISTNTYVMIFAICWAMSYLLED